MAKEWHPLGTTILDINTPLTEPYTLTVPLPPQQFTKFLINSFIDDNHDEQLMQVFFNGGKGIINAILDVDPKSFPITLSFEFLYNIDDYHLIGHSTPLTNQNANSIIDLENPPPNFNNWSHFFRTINPNSASFTITPYIADQLNHTYDLDSFIFFRCVESTESENQTQREIHIQIIQQKDNYLKQDNRNWVTHNWTILGTDSLIYNSNAKKTIIFSYQNHVINFLASIQNGKMKNLLLKGLPIRVSNVYLNKLDRSGIEWVLLRGLQMKLVEKKLCLWASKIQEYHHFFKREGLMIFETYYRWRNGYLELQLFFGLR